jgi:hypothetical protein
MNPIREYLALVVVTWMTLAPFVVFQALLCARDDYQQEYYGESQKHDAPTATETVTPILVILGWVWISATAVSFRINTAYQVGTHASCVVSIVVTKVFLRRIDVQEAREAVLHDAAGLRVMYQF